MEVWLWLLILLLSIVTAGLMYKLYVIRRAALEIEREFALRLHTDTNTQMHLSCRDAAMLKLATAINRELVRLRKQRLRFLQGDKALKEAVTNISHDLRTPLTAICGYLDLLGEVEKSEETARYLSQISGRVEAMKQLTEELFRYSVLASGESFSLEPVDLCRAVSESLLSFYGAMQAKGITPEIKLCENPVMRHLDSSALNRIFSNLIGNALKYSDGDLCVSMHENGTIVFANSASRLNAVSAAQLFDRFYTVETGEHASGLGLSIAKLLTERMGGTIEAEYADGKLRMILRFSIG